LTEQGKRALALKGAPIEETSDRSVDSAQIEQNEKLIKSYKENQIKKEGEKLLALLPQGEGSGLNADLLDGLHAREIIEKAGPQLAKGPTFGGGGGGLTQHGNEFHTPDFSEVTHNHNLNDLTEKNHASLSNVMANQHHNQLHNLASADHPDVSIAGPADTEVLTFEGATSLWKNKPAGGGAVKTYATKLVGFSATCDYVCDGVADEVEINQAIAAVVVLGGGDVQLERGTYTLAASVTMGSEVWLHGAGYDTILLHPDAGGFDMITASSKHYMIISDMKIEGTALATCCIYFSGCTRSDISRVWTHHSNDEGIHFAGGSDYNKIIGNLFEDHHDQAIYLEYARYCVVDSNVFTSNIWQVYMGASSYNNAIVGNTCVSGSTGGIYSAGPENTINGNYIQGAGYGIQIAGNENVVVGNNIKNVTVGIANTNGSRSVFNGNFIDSSTSVSGGIYVSAGSNHTIASNIVFDSAGYGIYVASASNAIISNVIDSPDSASANAYDGIRATAAGAAIIGNTISNTHGHNVGNGIHSTGGTSTITGNTVSGFDRDIYVTGTGTSVLNNTLTSASVALFYDGGTNTRLASIIVPFVSGYDIQQSGILVDGEEDYADTWTMLPVEVQQVVRAKVYARSAATETHAMEADFVIYGAADNEAYNTHDGSAASLASTSTNFAADDVIYWTLTAAGLLAMLGKDSIQVRIDGAAADGDNCATNAYVRTCEIEYV